MELDVVANTLNLEEMEDLNLDAQNVSRWFPRLFPYSFAHKLCEDTEQNRKE